ncbi:transketolase [Pancytospora epiphaga]|nr:transketolase [Pancytospora epiphaga]
MKEIENLRMLCAEIVERAGSGHPGAAMGLSHFMHILYTEFILLDPDNSRNPCRDILIMSNGHACVIQYIMNYFLGYLTLDDLKGYRRLNSRTPGHPERNTYGIEISTGPLGQGVAASVGFAISSELISRIGLDRINKSINNNTNEGMNKTLDTILTNNIDNKSHIYCIFGDGCYQEGISQEAFSFCSKQGLNNITFIYDYNKSTIDGSTDLSMNEDVVARFKAFNFDVFDVNGYDTEGIRKALKTKSDKPKVIILRTDIGKDTTLEGSCETHGKALGNEVIRKLKELYGGPKEEFFITEELKESYSKAKERMKREIKKRNRNIEEITDAPVRISYEKAYQSEKGATRKHFSNALNNLKTSQLILSGCADLTGSVLSKIESAVDFSQEKGVNAYLRFGIREHAMCGVMNGIAGHGFFVPISGTFLNFITYGYPSVRLAAMDNLKVVYVLSHDSIQLGGDGPTHQPVEVLAAMRATPNLVVLRPCDGRETRAALVLALREPGPVALILSRQEVEEIEETAVNGEDLLYEEGVAKGAYYLIEEKNHEIIILATGAEVSLAYEVRKCMKDRRVSIVSFISFELFERQEKEYKKRILDEGAVKVSIEALSTFGWSKYSDLQIGLDRFGMSGPGSEVYKELEFTGEEISARISDFIRKK